MARKAERETVVYEGAESTQRLRDLGFTKPELFREGMEVGLTARFSRSKYAPRTAGGYDQWATAVENIREQLSKDGWTEADAANFPRSVNSSQTMAIGLLQGDAATGLRYSTPKTARKKGPATWKVVNKNRQLDLFAKQIPVAVLPKVAKKPGSNEPLTYFLLWYLDRKMRQVRLEVSCPHMLEDGKIAGWIERILLPLIALDPIDPATRRSDDDAPEVDVRVTRRG